MLIEITSNLSQLYKFTYTALIIDMKSGQGFSYSSKIGGIKMNKKYTTLLTGEEIERLNNLENNYEILAKTKANMMSVYSYMLKHGADTVDGLKKSFSDLWDMYKRYHKNIKSLANFTKIIYKLKDNNFISFEKVGKVNVYHARFFLKQEVKDKVKDKVKDEKHLESIDMTNVEEVQENTQIQNTNNNYITIINNTSEDVAPVEYKNSSSYIEACKRNSKDTLAPFQLMLIAYDLLKAMKRRSEKLVNMIRNKLMDKMNIVRVNAHRYVETVVLDCIAKYEFNRELYAKTIATNKNNYKHAYNKANRSVANFTQREYDYDKLEKYLLGEDIDVEELEK